MSRDEDKNKKSRFPMSTFWLVLAVLLCTAGVSMAIIIGMDRGGWNEIIQTHIMVFYWIGVSVLLTVMIRSRMKAVYDVPVQAISDATKRVAKGDFSVRIDPVPQKEKGSYLDQLISDLNTMIAELGSIETLKTDFISNVSHEIKTPIAVISNYARLLESGGLSETERKEYAHLISDASAKLSTLITNILKLNRLENHRIGLKAEKFDLSACLAECILGFESVWENKNIGIIPEIEDGVIVESDSELLSIVWNNLLSNAFKFTGEGGNVFITLKREREYVTVIVRDTGCGMSQDCVSHIFDKFYQADTSHATEGNGLGLALVKRILDMTGGTVNVSSALGEGSTFTVLLKQYR